MKRESKRLTEEKLKRKKKIKKEFNYVPEMK